MEQPCTHSKKNKNATSFSGKEALSSSPRCHFHQNHVKENHLSKVAKCNLSFSISRLSAHILECKLITLWAPPCLQAVKNSNFLSLSLKRESYNWLHAKNETFLLWTKEWVETVQHMHGSFRNYSVIRRCTVCHSKQQRCRAEASQRAGIQLCCTSRPPTHNSFQWAPSSCFCISSAVGRSTSHRQGSRCGLTETVLHPFPKITTQMPANAYRARCLDHHAAWLPAALTICCTGLIKSSQCASSAGVWWTQVM